VKQSQILVRYGEIGLKAEYTRRQFTRQLKHNLMQAFSMENIHVNIEMMRGRFFIHTTEIERSINVLKNIFGIVSVSPVWESSSELSALIDDVLKLMESYLDQNISFALRVRRSGNHEYTSQDAAIKVGNALVDRFH
jgi:thiamine biosynthesis protein ThiI